VAATLGELGPVEVAELVARSEITDDGHWPSLTVSFHRWSPDPDAVVPTP
jgi:hypothetical protein